VPTRNLFGTATTGATNSDTLTVAMATAASGAQVGDWVDVFVSSDGIQIQSIASGDGWTKEAQQEASGQANLALYRYIVTVAGTVPDLVVDMGASTEMAVAHWFRIRPAAGQQLNALAPAVASGSSTNPNPASVTNSTGAARSSYFIAAWGGDGNNVVSTAAPAGYGNHQSTGIANNNGCAIGSADKTTASWASAAVEDPGTFTRATEQWAALTVAYYETVAATPVTANPLAVGSPVLASPALTQAHVFGANALAVGSPVLGAPPLTQAHVFGANALAVGSPELGAPAVTAIPPPVELTASPLAVGSPELASPGVIQAHVFAALALAVASPAFAEPTLTQAHIFTASPLVVAAPDLGAPVLTQAHAFTAAPLAAAAPVLGAPVLTQAHVFEAATLAVASPELGTPELLPIAPGTVGVVALPLVVGSPIFGAPSLTEWTWADVVSAPVAGRSRSVVGWRRNRSARAT
jgi:hypothetical protein